MKNNIMKKIILPVLFFFILISFNCSSGNEEIKISVTNPVDIERTDEYISINIESLKQKYSDFNFQTFSLYDNEKEIPYQIERGITLSFAVNLGASETKHLTIKNSPPKDFKSRAYAEVSMKVDYNFVNGKYSGGRFQNYDSLKVPAGHTDHNALFRYEGPGWESDKVGYRFYIDWRNRIDIFGKKTNELVLKDVGINDREAKDDSYHSMLDWGMDVFKVGNTLGIGSYGMMVNDSLYMVSERDSVICVIAENGPVKAEVKTNFYGWKAGDKKYDLTSHLSITGGSRLTKAELDINDSPENLVTGLAKEEHSEYFEKKSNGEWSYIALYGKQSLADDNLGIALFYNNDELINQKETSDSYAVLLKPVDGQVVYYFCAAWEKEPEGIKNKEEFISYLDKKMEELNNPVNIEF